MSSTFSKVFILSSSDVLFKGNSSWSTHIHGRFVTVGLKQFRTNNEGTRLNMYLAALTQWDCGIHKSGVCINVASGNSLKKQHQFTYFLACFSIRKHCVALFWCWDCRIGIYKYACTCVVLLTFVLTLLEEWESEISGTKVFFSLGKFKIFTKAEGILK